MPPPTQLKTSFYMKCNIYGANLGSSDGGGVKDALTGAGNFRQTTKRFIRFRATFRSVVQAKELSALTLSLLTCVVHGGFEKR